MESSSELDPKRQRVRALMMLFFLATCIPFGFSDSSKPGATDFAKPWIGPDGETLPFRTYDEIEDFLLTADVLNQDVIPIGTTKPRKVLLEREGLRANACFRDVDIYMATAIIPGHGTRTHWRDSCEFECAAYQLAKLLGLNNIPPVVKRRIGNKEGTLQIWVENTFNEFDRAEKSLVPPDSWRYKMQWHVMALFDALIYNDDRTAANILYDQDWTMWLIDHTRSFTRISSLPEPLLFKYCERNVWNRLLNLDEGAVKEALSEYLRSQEISALLKRREELIAYFQKRIERKGEKKVLFSFY